MTAPNPPGILGADLRERIKRLGGALAVEHGPGAGTTLAAQTPPAAGLR